MANLFNCGYSRGAVEEAFFVHQRGDVSALTTRRKELYDAHFVGFDNNFLWTFALGNDALRH